MKYRANAEMDLHELARRRGSAALLFSSTTEAQRAFLEEKHGPERAIALVREMQSALDETREMEKRADMGLLSTLLASGNYQVHGFTKAGGPVVWIRLLPGVYNVRDLTTYTLYFRWIILWHCVLMTSIGRSGALVFYDRDRSLIDFNLEFLSKGTNFLCLISTMIRFPLISVVESATGRIIVKALKKLLPADQLRKIRITNYTGMRPLLADGEHQVPSQFFADRKFVPCLDSCGNYHDLLQRRGMETVSLSLINVPGQFDMEQARVKSMARKDREKQGWANDKRLENAGAPFVPGKASFLSNVSSSSNSSLSNLDSNTSGEALC